MKLAIMLQWLAVLACPAMMLWCMWSMFGGGKHRGASADERSGGSGNLRDLEDQIRALKTRVAELEAEREAVGRPARATR